MGKWRTEIEDLDPWSILSWFVLPRPALALARYNDTARFKKRGKLFLPVQQSVSAFPYGTVSAAAAVDHKVVLTGETISFTDSGNTTSAGVRFNRDGSIDEQGPGSGTFSQIDAGEWWELEPVTAIGDDYDVVSVTGGSGTWSTAAEVDDTWIQMNSDRLWNVVVLSINAPDSKSTTRTFSIRPTGGGATLASASFTCAAVN